MIAQEKRRRMMSFRPKPGISTKALKNHLSGRAFSKFSSPIPPHTHSVSPPPKQQPTLPFSSFLLPCSLISSHLHGGSLAWHGYGLDFVEKAKNKGLMG